ncbi:hypothetical protein E2N92_01095 [Methanofollis formosanus]|uniref:PIN domain-containing protein n=1 Tax=Methanofollis formosanus TaxID=299308 RepID=A0A8G0ZYS4_9EURY|nr:hypothetical protein [Methanofollis formosanus]QYZ78125.1 hypothetical protein E2N92_01095 [Methanofollis formosanus]
MRRTQGIPPTCAVDANVLFDLFAGGVLHDLFSLECVFLTTDIVAHEVRTIPLTDLLCLGLEIRELPGEQVLEMLELRKNYPALSMEDISVMVLARHSGAVLLTGDGTLRKTAREEGVVLHGTLWLMDLLVAGEIVTPSRAAGAIETMRQNGRWLPGEECERRIDGWRETE